MKCSKCPLFHSWNNESDKGESCGLFGDGWDNVLQYEDSAGNIVGCHIERCFIEKTDRQNTERLDEETDMYGEWLELPEPQKEKTVRLIDADMLIDHMKNTWDMQELYLPVHFEDLVEEMPTIATITRVEKEIPHDRQEKELHHPL